ncbi:MAG: cupin domain-containing protein [Candidatus Margulisbacteria bacterium]|nr:cupin domain-containing protein [Candidatus Margulisiibacteriota bacterium]
MEKEFKKLIIDSQIHQIRTQHENNKEFLAFIEDKSKENKVMLKKKNELIIEKRENMRGGKGAIIFEHYFTQKEIQANCRLCAKITVPVGGSIGLHRHDNEDEVFIILKGQGICDDGTKKSQFSAGDALLTVSGGSHSIENTGKEDIEFIAIVMPYNKSVE